MPDFLIKSLTAQYLWYIIKEEHRSTYNEHLLRVLICPLPSKGKTTSHLSFLNPDEKYVLSVLLRHLCSRWQRPVFSHALTNTEMKLKFSIGPLIVVIIFAVLLHIINKSMNDAQQQQRSAIPAKIKVKKANFDTPMAGTHLLKDTLPL